MRSKNYERNLKIFELREKGETFTAIGKRFNLSGSRAQQIYLRMLSRGAKDRMEQATDITSLSTYTRRAMDKATGIENCSLIDFQNFAMHNPDWGDKMPESCRIELGNFCCMNGIIIEKNLYNLGLDVRACNGIRRRTGKEYPTLDDLKEVLKDPDWRHNLLRVRNMGIKSLRILEKFALEHGLLDEPENVLGMGLSPEAVAVIGKVNGRGKQITPEDVKKVVGPLEKNNLRVYVRRDAPWEIVEEIKAFAIKHKLYPENP